MRMGPKGRGPPPPGSWVSIRRPCLHEGLVSGARKGTWTPTPTWTTLPRWTTGQEPAPQGRKLPPVRCPSRSVSIVPELCQPRAVTIKRSLTRRPGLGAPQHLSGPHTWLSSVPASEPPGDTARAGWGALPWLSGAPPACCLYLSHPSSPCPDADPVLPPQLFSLLGLRGR